MHTRAHRHSNPILFERVKVGSFKSHGSQGDVAEGTIEGMSEKVAIKSLWDPEALLHSKNPGSAINLNEALSNLKKKVDRVHRILAAMATHPHVVKFVGISFSDTPDDVDKHKIYLITELVEGPNLQALYTNKKEFTDELLVLISFFDYRINNI